MSLYKIVLSLHGLLGALALVTFWLAGMTRKGSPVHRAAGKVYLAAMVVLLATAVPLALRTLLEGNTVAGAFLLYLEVITITTVWTGWRAIRDKRDWATYAGTAYRVLAWLNVASGAAILVLGLVKGGGLRYILVGFSLIGLLAGRSMLRFAKSRPTDPRWWMGEHYGAMIGNGVATHIAFLSIGLPKLLPSLAGPVMYNAAWLGPLAIAVIARVLLDRKYMKARAVAPVGAATAATPLA